MILGPYFDGKGFKTDVTSLACRSFSLCITHTLSKNRVLNSSGKLDPKQNVF